MSVRINFFTMEGNPPCEDPLTCAHGEEARAHLENLRQWAASRGAPPTPPHASSAT